MRLPQGKCISSHSENPGGWCGAVVFSTPQQSYPAGVLSGSEFKDKFDLPVCSRSSLHANPHRLEASPDLEEHGGWCHGSKLPSSLKDVLAVERGKWKPLSCRGWSLFSSLKSWELVTGCMCGWSWVRARCRLRSVRAVQLLILRGSRFRQDQSMTSFGDL